MENFDELIERASKKSSTREQFFMSNNAQALYKMVRDYYQENPRATDAQVYKHFCAEFGKMNLEIATLPSIQSDTLRYNVCKYLNRNEEERRKAYNKLIKEEEKGKKLNITDNLIYDKHRLKSIKIFMTDLILTLRDNKSAFDEEYRNKIINFARCPKGVQNEFKASLSTEERRTLESHIELFCGSEFDQVSILAKKSEVILRDSLRKDYINTMLYIGQKLKHFGVLQKYYEMQNRILKDTPIEDLAYPLSQGNSSVISIEQLFEEETLKKLDMDQLSILTAFWRNKFNKEIDGINKAFFVVSTLNKYKDIRDAIPDSKTGNINIDINDSELQTICLKMNCLDIISRKLLKNVDDEELESIEINGKIVMVKRAEQSAVIGKLDFEVGNEYEEYFSKLLPNLKHSFEKDVETYRIMDNVLFNSYRIKDLNMIAILSNLSELEYSRNWGIILEDNIKDPKMILLGVDVVGVNMPLRLHIEKSLVKEFMQANQNNSLIPIYLGANDFYVHGKYISTQVLMPMCKKQRDILDTLLKQYRHPQQIQQQKYSQPTKQQKHLQQKKHSQQDCLDVDFLNLLEHIQFIASGKEFPSHLKDEAVIKKKTTKVMPPKKYYDLETGIIYQMSKNGELIQLQTDSKAKTNKPIPNGGNMQMGENR